MNLSISNVINISVSAPGKGAGEYNTSNLAIFTKETSTDANYATDGYKIYLEPSEVGVDFGTSSETYKMALAVFSQQPNILANNGYLVAIKQGTSESLVDAIVRSSTLVEYFGLMTDVIVSASDLLLVGAAIQPLNKIGFFGSKTATDLDASDNFDDVRAAGYTHTRCLFYGGSTVSEMNGFVAAYAGRALSTNFNGSNTTSTMHLKDLIGVLPDPTMTQTLLNKAQACGADCYISIQGVAKCFTSGENGFFDDVYNLMWFVGLLQISEFNVLAQTSTKIAQTENGVSSLKSAAREVCEQAVRNQFVAPGAWTSPNTFGVQEDFLANISQVGYYIYSTPVALQSPTDRADRKAPLIQLAIKYAGAIHSSNVIVNINQ